VTVTRSNWVYVWSINNGRHNCTSRESTVAIRYENAKNKF